jgi:hypothetical protein
MSQTKSKKQSDNDAIAEVTLEMAKPRVALSAGEHSDADRPRNSSGVTDICPLDPMKLLRDKVAEELAAPSLAGTGMLTTPSLNICPKDSRGQSNANNLVVPRHPIRFF